MVENVAKVAVPPRPWYVRMGGCGGIAINTPSSCCRRPFRGEMACFDWAIVRNGLAEEHVAERTCFFDPALKSNRRETPWCAAQGG